MITQLNPLWYLRRNHSHLQDGTGLNSTWFYVEKAGLLLPIYGLASGMELYGRVTVVGVVYPLGWVELDFGPMKQTVRIAYSSI